MKTLNKKHSLRISLIVILIILFILYVIKKEDSSKDLLISNKENISKNISYNTEQEETISSQIKDISNHIKVYICGQVLKPGVYDCDEKARVNDLIIKAGGSTKEADLTAINLAAKLSDGQQIVIYKKGESPSSLQSQIATTSTKEGDFSLNGQGIININIADKASLMTLPGIGETKAEAIVNYRNEEGNFNTIEDVMKVPGIKEGAFNKIKDLIKI